MTTDAAIAQRIQLADPGKILSLYVLDATNLGEGGNIYRFTSMSDGQSGDPPTEVVFDGNTYTPIAFDATGFEWSGKGSLPQPKIKISNVNLVLASAVITFDDLLGATLTRIRTFERHLDGGSDPDPTAVFPLDIYTVERKITHNKLFIEWELSAVMDQQGKQLPGRQFIKDACTHIYRKYDPTATDLFDYTSATCPYVGVDYFTAQGDSTSDPSLDFCGKKLSDCRLRFGQNGTLPTRAFPGIGRY